MFRRARKEKMTELPIVAGAEEYRPGLFYFTTARGRADRAWPGPKYISTARWCMDLLEVIGQIQAIVRTNANLPAGLQAAAREHRRQIRDWTQRRIGLFFRAAFIPIILLFIFLMMIGMGGFNGAEAIGFAALISGILCTGYGVIAFYRAGTIEAVLLKLRDDLEAGHQLSEAMRRMHQFFPPIVADLVAIGERTGQLSAGLEQVSSDLLESTRLRAGLGKQSLYFLLVAAAQASMIVFISVKVLPVFIEVLEEFGVTDLPAASQWVMDMTDFIRYGILGYRYNEHGELVTSSARRAQMLVVLLAAAWFVLWAVRGGLRRIAFTPRHGLWLYIPGIAGIVRAQNLSAIGQLMAALLRAGMPLPEALESVAACRLSGPYRRGLRRVQERVEQDTCLAEALAPEPRLFPKGFQAFVRLGEHSGLLAEAFARTGEQYRRRHATFNHYLRTAVTPAGILLLGAVNLMITLAAFQMLVAMADSVMGDF